MYNNTVNKETGKFFYGYIILIASFLSLLIVYGAQYSFGVFLKPVLTDFGWSRALTAGAYSMNFVFFALWSILAGRLVDKFNPRLVMTFYGLVVAASYFLMSQISEAWHIYLIYGICLSLGNAGIYITVSSIIVRWFIHKRVGLATGILGSGIGVGVTFMPPLASFLISDYDWRVSYIAIALIALIIPVIAQFLKRDPATAEKLKQATDEVQVSNSLISSQGFSVSQALRTRQLWMICIIFFIATACVQTVLVHIVAYATDAGITATIAATILSVIGIASTISKVGAGGALDRLKGKTILIIVFILLLASFLMLQLPAVIGLLYFFAAVFAAGYGGYSVSQSPTIAEYFGLRSHGTLFGISQAMAGLGCAAGSFFSGLVFDTTGSYNLAFIGCAVLCVLGMMLTIILKPADTVTPERR